MDENFRILIRKRLENTNKLKDDDVFLEEYTQISQLPRSFHVIGYHGTRLFDCECQELRRNGFKETTIDLFYEKIKNIKNSKYRKYLHRKLSKITYTQSDGKIYVKVGKNVFSREGGNLSFLNNWGGETIYKLYDCKNNKIETEIFNYLRKRTTPYIIVCRIPSYRLDYVYDTYLQNGATCICDNREVEIIDIVPVNSDLIDGVITGIENNGK